MMDRLSVRWGVLLVCSRGCGAQRGIVSTRLVLASAAGSCGVAPRRSSDLAAGRSEVLTAAALQYTVRPSISKRDTRTAYSVRTRESAD